MLRITKWLWAASKMHSTDWICCFSREVSAILMAPFIQTSIWFNNPLYYSFLQPWTEQSISVKMNSVSEAQNWNHNNTSSCCKMLICCFNIPILLSSFMRWKRGNASCKIPQPHSPSTPRYLRCTSICCSPLMLYLYLVFCVYVSQLYVDLLDLMKATRLKHIQLILNALQNIRLLL